VFTNHYLFISRTLCSISIYRHYLNKILLLFVTFRLEPRHWFFKGPSVKFIEPPSQGASPPEADVAHVDNDSVKQADDQNTKRFPQPGAHTEIDRIASCTMHFNGAPLYFVEWWYQDILYDWPAGFVPGWWMQVLLLDFIYAIFLIAEAHLFIIDLPDRRGSL
jgi:hypothetical protein